jgi:monovalent cation/hydrogen antiporter
VIAAAAGGGGGHELELVVVGILLAVSVLFVLAYVSGVPYPIWLTVGGAALGFFPGIPDVRLEPDLVLLIVLPPLLYSAAFFSDLRELRRNVRPIGLLAVGLVLATAFGVAAVAHAIVPGLSWEAAIVLGAVLGPTDPVAATAIAGRIGAPRRIVTILEGESLINDSTALIAFKFAVGAATAGTFSLIDAAGEFVLSVTGGVLIGLAAGWAVAQVRARIEDVPTEAVLSLGTAYFAYLPADAVGASGVMAAVTTGIYLGWHAPRLTTAQTRLQLYALWEILVFVLNSLLFVLVGLQLPSVLDALEGEAAGSLAWYAVAIALTVMAVRFLWVFPFTYLPSRLAGIRVLDPEPSWRTTTIIAFTGMRGAVSLAAALAVPPSVPGRDLIVFLCFTTILWTVCVEGLSLPSLLRLLRVEEDGEQQREEDKARLLAANAAIRRVDDLLDEDWVRAETAERVKAMYDFRKRRFAQRLGKLDGDGEEDRDGRSADYQRLMREVLEAQRLELFELRRAGRIGDDIQRRIERDLDLEETRLA